MKTHIRSSNGRTYCGRLVGLILPAHYGSIDTGHVKPPPGTVACIDTRVTAIDEATCTACQRSDDRRVLENYNREQRALPPEKRDGYEG